MRFFRSHHVTNIGMTMPHIPSIALLCVVYGTVQSEGNRYKIIALIEFPHKNLSNIYQINYPIIYINLHNSALSKINLHILLGYINLRYLEKMIAFSSEFIIIFFHLFYNIMLYTDSYICHRCKYTHI